MKIFEAAEVVLKEAGRPMGAKEIYTEIVKKDLFTFGAKDPVSIVSKTLRKKSDSPMNTGSAVFLKQSNNTYGLAEWSRK